MVFQLKEKILVSVFTNRSAVLVLFLANCCPVMISSMYQSSSCILGSPHAPVRYVGMSESLMCQCRTNPQLVACAHMGEDGIIQGQVVLSALTQWEINEGRILLLKMTHYTSSM